MEQPVVVVGGGIAGLIAANRAAQLNRQVVVLEKQTEEKYLCNSRITGGTYQVAFHDSMAGEDELFRAIGEATHGYAEPRLARTVARNSRRVMQWLENEGVSFVSMGEEVWLQKVLAPRITAWVDGAWAGKGGDALLTRLEENLLRRGGRVRRGARAVRLRLEDGRCTGVVVDGGGAPETITCSAAILADGGYQGNNALMSETVSPQPGKLKHRGVPAGNGDGILMARAVGAATVGMGSFYGHLLSRDALHNPRLWPFPIVDFLAAGSILVKDDGERFANEGYGGVYLSNRVAALPDPLCSSIIFDEEIWQGAGKHFVRSANPILVEMGGTLHSAPNLNTLAVAAGIDPQKLSATVEAYNAAVRSGKLDSLSPSRRADWVGFDGAAEKYKPSVISKPPFYALPVCAGVTYTTGGLAVDGDARVLDANDAPIPGLYAVGSNVGGIEGGPLCGYIGGLAKDSVFGLCAAEHAAAMQTIA